MSKTQPLDLDDGLSCGENCSKSLYVQIVYYEMSNNSFRRANLLYRLPQSISLRGRVSKHAQSQQICPNSLSERLQESQNTENVDITTEIRPDTWKFSFLYSPLESASVVQTISTLPFWSFSLACRGKRREVLQMKNFPSKIPMGPQYEIAGVSTSKSGDDTN